MGNKKDIKQKLIALCREQLQDSVNNLKEAVNEIQQSANEYGAPKDRYDSYRTQLLRRRDMLAKQLKQTEDQLIALDKIDLSKTCETPAFGAVVITDKQKLFISTGVGKIETGGETWYAVSPVVPVVKAMTGKKAGEEFVFNGMKFRILDVY